MARRAASKARDLKWIRWDMAFMQQRSGLLEEENMKLRDGHLGDKYRLSFPKAIDFPRLLEHSYQPHDMILENKKPKECCEAVDHAKRLEEDPMLLLRGLSCCPFGSLWFMDLVLVALPEIRAEVDHIGHDIMQERCGCACIVEYHHLTSHDMSSPYESLLWGMQFDFSSPQKEDGIDNAFMQERSGLLEEENKKLRDGLFDEQRAWLETEDERRWDGIMHLCKRDLGPCGRKRTRSFMMGSLVKLGELEEAKAVGGD
ncbi:hypothetical protein SASPL_150401 [Salvia splendens]|uniref:Uncharacterized protein n=1 Tax=Salvia splendens TaxID=180675 RepID=A0A8X8Z2M7_SALSN|nr:hypothetical protein SASPL_150401 [Salvia splendens]